MAIHLPLGLSSEEIRVLQEFRRLNAQTLPLDTIKAIKHPVGAVGEKPAVSLVGKGFLVAGEEGYTLAPSATDFLAIEATPLVEGTSDAAASAAANPDADGV
ncbi:MAG TPA: hypothetical protein VEO54_10225 [Thermoanaerobaculia bacterium]|nr:hypothetical protein [Thermoanaerobaculia bacterium]